METLLCSGIYGKDTRMGPKKEFEGPSLGKWSVGLLKMTKNMSPWWLLDSNRPFHLRTLCLRTDKCGAVNVRDQIAVTLGCYGGQWWELPFSGRSFEMIEMGINAIKRAEPQSLICSLRTPANKHLSWGKGRGGFCSSYQHRAHDAIQTAEEKCCLAELFEISRYEHPRLTSLSWEEVPFYSCLPISIFSVPKQTEEKWWWRIST